MENQIIEYAALGVAIVLGVLLWMKPANMIDLQIACYKGVGWRMEPISREKEVLHTKRFGIFVVFLGILALITLWRMDDVIAFIVSAL